MFRKKTIQCCIWPNIISWRPSEEHVRTFNYSKGPNHHYENEFIDKTYLAWSQAVKPEERQRHAREIADHLFDEFADIPVFWFANEVVVNLKLVGDWVYAGLAAGRSTSCHLVNPAAKLCRHGTRHQGEMLFFLMPRHIRQQVVHAQADR